MGNWLDLRQVAYLIAVVEQGSFTRAAQALRVAQPSLSQQLRALERQVGAELVERGPRGVVPTAAGRAFLVRAREAVAAADGASSDARAAADGAGGSLHVATVTSIATWILPRAFAAWRPMHPGVALKVSEFPDRRSLEGAVINGDADLAVGPRPITWRGPVCTLGDERYAIVVPPDDPRGGQTEAELGEFAYHDWILYAPEHGLHDFVLDVCRTAGFTPRGVVETRQVDAAARLAAAGLGVALVPDGAVPADLGKQRVDLAAPPRREVVAYARSAFCGPGVSFLATLQTVDLGLSPSDCH
ncbi:MAG: LysR family transcriptional regulator [Frankia sp.]